MTASRVLFVFIISLTATLTLTIAGFCAETTTDTTACPLPGQWESIPELTDEFEGEKLDATRWWPTNPSWKGRQPGLFSEKNVTVADGKLQLTARAEEIDGPAGYHSFTTAAVKSKVRVKYGYFEIKARAMDSRCSSAFWFYTSEKDWWTEIDVFEIGGRAPGHEDIMHTNVHVFVTPEDGRRHWSDAGKFKAPGRLADRFHTYGLEWTPEVIRFYFDGEMIRERKNTHWHQALHMNFDSETMPDWFGLPEKQILPSTFSIEYVRSWQRPE